MGVFNYLLKDTTFGSRFLLAFDFFCFLPVIPLRLTSVTPPFFFKDIGPKSNWIFLWSDLMIR